MHFNSSTINSVPKKSKYCYKTFGVNCKMILLEKRSYAMGYSVFFNFFSF